LDPAKKKVEGRKRHLLVDTAGLVLEVRVHSAKVPDEDGIRLLLLNPVRDRFSAPFSPVGRFRRLPREGQEVGRGSLGRKSVEVVRKPPKPVSEEVEPRFGHRSSSGPRKARGGGLLAEAHATARLQSVAEEVGGGEDFLVVGSKP
jgi:hypothetical protein